MVQASTALGNVDAFVNMMSAATGVPEWKLESWLDIYFNLRVIQCLEKEEAAAAVNEGMPEPAEAVAMPRVEAPLQLTHAPKEIAHAIEELPEEPASEKKLSGNGSQYKNAVLERLRAARSCGVTVKQIVQASYNGLKDVEVLDALGCRHLHVSKWTAIDKALSALGY